MLGAFELGLGLPDASLGRLDLCRGLVRASFGVDALLHELEDARDLFARVVALGLCRDQPFLCRADRRGARTDGLADAGQFGIRLLQGNLERLGVDAKQHIPDLRLLIIDNVDLDHPAGNFRGHSHDEGLDGRLRGIRREPIGDQRIEEQHHDQAENDQRPPPYGIAWGAVLLGVTLRGHRLT